MFPVHNQNAGWNTLPFSICKIIQDVSQIDTNLSDQLKISVQVFCPTCLLNPYEKRNTPWKGNLNDNVYSYWKPDVARGTIKAIVELAPKNRKVSKKSKQNACI